MEALTLSIHWHDNNQPIYSVHLQPNVNKVAPIRLATGGGDNNVRIWELLYNEDKSKVKSVRYLSTLTKHTQAVNVVRFDPKGQFLATAGDDGTVLIWQLSDKIVRDFDDDPDDEVQESWIVKHACRSSTAEIYDLAWSPDSKYILTGSMDNVSRIYNAQTGKCVKELAEHNHYVQGVCWDPKNEFLATQSADRSIHVYSLKKNNDAASSWTPKSPVGTAGSVFDISPTIFYKITKADLPKTLYHYQRTSSSSPSAALTPSTSANASSALPSAAIAKESASALSTPKTKRIISTTPSPKISHASMVSATEVEPQSTAGEIPGAMDPPPTSHRKRRLSSASTSSIARSVSPSPPVALPAVRPLEVNQNHLRSTLLYHNETLLSFFRRLAFSIDGSLLLTPSGIFKNTIPGAEPANVTGDEGNSSSNNTKEETTNTVYVYTRGGLNSSPVYHLPGLRKPAVAIAFSPIKYKLRDGYIIQPKRISIKKNRVGETMSISDNEDKSKPNAKKPIKSIIALPYRMMFAVATQDSVVLYDTQQQEPLGLVSNLHYSAFTDLTWSSDGKTMIISSTDGFCSVIALKEELLGEEYIDEKEKETASRHLSSVKSTSSQASAPSSSSPEGESAPKKRKVAPTQVINIE